jgi:hydroxymethylpyrimidine/phosphomethylpyrimidine kinase
MLTSADTIKVVAESLQHHKISTVVVDPVCISYVVLDGDSLF